MPLHERRSTGALRSISFFEGWSDDEMEHFERIMVRGRFAAGEVLIAEGNAGQAFLVLISGEAEVTRGERRIGRLQAGDHLGEMSLLDDSPASATVVAISEVEALVLHRRDFQNVLETIPSLARRILATLARWARQTSRDDS